MVRPHKWDPFTNFLLDKIEVSNLYDLDPINMSLMWRNFCSSKDGVSKIFDQFLVSETLL